MLQAAPFIEDVLPKLSSFVENDIIVGHHVSFDVNFLYDACVSCLNIPFRNDFVDTMRIFRKLHPELQHHRLRDMVDFYNLTDIPSHRAESDCIATFSCFNALKNDVLHRYNDIEDFLHLFVSNNKRLDLRTINATIDSFDETNPFYKKHCVFTGTLEKMNRKDAAQLIANLGGIPDNSVTKKTNFLILGNNDYCKSIKDGKSNKQKTAEGYILNGLDISIVSEYVFYDMIGI